jgi:ectoine utilization protein EutC
MSVLILTEGELRRCAVMNDQALRAVEQAFTWLAEDQVNMPPIMHLEVADHHGDVDIKSAYVSGLDHFAVKLASGYFENAKRGLPSSSAMMVLFRADTGFCAAVLLDNGYLTDLRTGLAGAVAAKHLAPERVSTVGVVGTGAQARYQVQSLQLVRSFERLLVFGRDSQRLSSYREEMRKQVGLEVEPVQSVEALVSQSDLVVTTTPSKQALIQSAWLHPGLHITAMGSDLAGKQELAPQVLADADLLVCDRRSQCAAMGELQHAIAAGLISKDEEILELGSITSGCHPGRSDPDQITVCDLTGTGVQDTAIAALAYQRAQEMGLGVKIEA